MDEPHKGTIHLSTFEEERRRLKLENHYLRWILDTLHKNITISDAEPQLESHPPEVLMNDQTLVALTTNVWKVTHKLYDLEMELDYTYRRISQLFTMIVGGEGSKVTPSAKKNKITATGRKPRSSRDRTNEQSEQSLKLEKDLELIASAWRDMKEKERKIRDLEEEKKHLQEELSNKEVLIIQHKDKTNRNIVTRQSHHPDIQTRIEVAEENVRAQKKVNADLAKKCEITRKDLEQKTEEYTKLISAKKELDSKYENLKQIHKKCSEEKSTLEGLKTKLESVISHLHNDVASLQEREIKQEDKIQQLNEEKESLLIRLSMIAGDRLTHDNANIADLSDVDRPTRLSKVYSELYDNEWTDAFEELTRKCQLSEKQAIHCLLEILLKAFQKCRQITWDRYKAMTSVAITLDYTHIINSAPSSKGQERKDDQNLAESKADHSPNVPEPVHQPPSGPSKEQESMEQATIQLPLSVDQETVIKKAWKTMNNAIKTEALELLHSVLITILGINEKETPNLSRYLICCVNLCWKMGMQERPLHLDIEAEKDDGQERVFNADKFGTYTKTGTKLDYIVWPALFMHEGGVILSKGIAQGC